MQAQRRCALPAEKGKPSILVYLLVEIATLIRRAKKLCEKLSLLVLNSVAKVTV